VQTGLGITTNAPGYWVPAFGFLCERRIFA
jgi:hypothetical protein